VVTKIDVVDEVGSDLVTKIDVVVLRSCPRKPFVRNFSCLL
jgi:hypothetical protein